MFKISTLFFLAASLGLASKKDCAFTVSALQLGKSLWNIAVKRKDELLKAEITRAKETMKKGKTK